MNLSPYAWLIGVEGKLTVDGQTEDVKMPFSDFLDLVKDGTNVGGFGLASGLRFTWEAALLVTHVTTKHWSFTGGYRALFWDRKTTDDGSHRADDARSVDWRHV